MAILSALCALSTTKHIPPFLCRDAEGILIAPFHPQGKKNSKEQVIYLYGQNGLMLFLVDRLIWPELHSIDKNAIHRPHEVKGLGKMSLSIELSFPSCQMFLEI